MRLSAESGYELKERFEMALWVNNPIIGDLRSSVPRQTEVAWYKYGAGQVLQAEECSPEARVRKIQSEKPMMVLGLAWQECRVTVRITQS